MDTTFAARPTSAPRRRRRPSWWAAIATTLVPLGTAVAVAGVMGSTASAPEGVGDVLISGAFFAWNLLPMLGSAVVLLWSGQRGWWPYAAATIGSVALAAVAGWALYDFQTSASSTAALIFLSLPIIEWTVVGATVGLVALSTVARARVRA